MPRLVDEPALDPTLVICDPHHHLWSSATSAYTIDELQADLASHPVASTVFVECGASYRSDGPEELRPLGETDWVVSVADDRLMRGVVGFADLTLGERVEPILAAHVEAARGRFRGIRHVASWDADPRIHISHSQPPPHLLAQPDYQAGAAAVARAGLLLEVWCYFPQLPDLIDLARAQPDTPIVLDHLGGPIGIGPYSDRVRSLAGWRAAMRAVARLENVVLKLGGIGMPVFGLDWHLREVAPGSEEVAEVWGRDIRWCIEQFGVDRCMFESNFPVDKRSFSYSACWNAFARIVDDFSAPDKAALFRGTASRVYQLG